ncbi:MAG: peptidoglycan editing factor PgeF [Gammaproteobacteria bacterium]|nr:peptidoglycan editing factor PgeF [Gammaproteobacteria bacterium]
MSDSRIIADWPAPANIMAGTTLRNSRFALPAAAPQLNQVHGTTVVRADSELFESGRPDADAIVADKPGAICVVRTADCLPILFCSKDGLEIAAAHAGWRGLAAGIVEETIAAMRTPAHELISWFGPAISQAAFEVGAEVREAFLDADATASAAFAQNHRGRWQANLYLLASQRLRRAGVTGIHGGGLCTYRDAERFYSYRRNGATGRLVSFVYRA